MCTFYAFITCFCPCSRAVCCSRLHDCSRKARADLIRSLCAAELRAPLKWAIYAEEEEQGVQTFFAPDDFEGGCARSSHMHDMTCTRCHRPFLLRLTFPEPRELSVEGEMAASSFQEPRVPGWKTLTTRVDLISAVLCCGRHALRPYLHPVLHRGRPGATGGRRGWAGRAGDGEPPPPPRARDDRSHLRSEHDLRAK